MKKYILYTLFYLGSIYTSYAQNTVQVTIRDGIEGGIKTKMESSATKLLTEINSAFNENRSLNTAHLNMTQQAREGLAALWENVHLYCDDSEVVESALHISKGFQIRQIPLMIRTNDKEATTDDEYQEGVLNFDANGTITRFNLTIGTNIYQDVMKKGKDVTDVQRRQQILAYVEHFRTAYNEKDLLFLDRIFSEDALIITGSVTEAMKTDGKGISYKKVSYTKQSKQEYMTRLRNSFAANRYIRVRFDDVKIMKHPKKEGFYGVTLHQLYSNSNGYSDDGYLFLLWQFNERDDTAQIHVRTWQPRYVGKEELPKEEIFTIGDFEIEL